MHSVAIPVSPARLDFLDDVLPMRCGRCGRVEFASLAVAAQTGWQNFADDLPGSIKAICPDCEPGCPVAHKAPKCRQLPGCQRSAGCEGFDRSCGPAAAPL